MKETIVKRILKLFSVKSIVTLMMTICMAGLLFGAIEPAKEVLTLYCTSYGAIITYFFTKTDTDNSAQT